MDNVTIHIRHQPSGEVRQYQDYFADISEESPEVWMWAEGSMCCDHNRVTYFNLAGEVQHPENHICGGELYPIRIISNEDGSILYDEFED